MQFLTLGLLLHQLCASPISPYSATDVTDLEILDSFDFDDEYSHLSSLSDVSILPTASASMNVCDAIGNFNTLIAKDELFFEYLNVAKDFDFPMDEHNFIQSDHKFNPLTEQDQVSLALSLMPDSFLSTELQLDPYIMVNGHRVDFNYNWPQVSADLVPMSSLTCQCYRHFFHELLAGNFKFIVASLKHKIVDISRPLRCATNGKYSSFLSFYLSFPGASIAMLNILLEAAKSVAPGLINMHYEDGFTPLHCAIQNGYSALIPTLLLAGTDINVIYTNHGTAAMHALMRGNDFALKLISNLRTTDLTATTASGDDIYTFLGALKSKHGIDVVINAHQPVQLDRFITFFNQLFQEKPQVASFYLKAILESSEALEKFHLPLKCLLYFLAKFGETNLIEKVIALGITPYPFYRHAPNRYTTLFHVAVRHNHLPVIAYLIRLGMSPISLDSEEILPIELAAEIGNIYIIEYLIENTNIEYADKALTAAIIADRDKVVRYLVAKMGNLDHFKIDEQPLWMYAYKRDKFAVFKALLSARNFNPHHEDAEYGSLCDCKFYFRGHSFQRKARKYIEDYTKNEENN